VVRRARTRVKKDRCCVRLSAISFFSGAIKDEADAEIPGPRLNI
jgi:hypothetical protein